MVNSREMIIIGLFCALKTEKRLRIYVMALFFLRRSEILYKIWSRKLFFPIDELHIILKLRNLEMCEHSSFFYFRHIFNIFLSKNTKN